MTELVAMKKKELTQVEHQPPAYVSQSDAIMVFIDRASRDPSVDMDKMDRLLAMYERVKANDAGRAFNAAMAAAKAEIPPIIKNREVDFTSQKGRTHYRHEDLAGIARIVDPILAKHGLSYRFRSSQDGPTLRVTCVMSHADGHSESNTLETKEDHSGNKNPIQAVGSAATYLQRYTLKLALGLASSHDDDAQSATSTASTISEAQVETLFALIAESGANMAQFLIAAKVPPLTDDTGIDAIKDRLSAIRSTDFDRLKGLLERKKGAAR